MVKEEESVTRKTCPARRVAGELARRIKLQVFQISNFPIFPRAINGAATLHYHV
jgi:hypothetical protein